jgi:hypothetical protein
MARVPVWLGGNLVVRKVYDPPSTTSSTRLDGPNERLARACRGSRR